jgi:hypothetical protein
VLWEGIEASQAGNIDKVEEVIRQLDTMPGGPPQDQLTIELVGRYKLQANLAAYWHVRALQAEAALDNAAVESVSMDEAADIVGYVLEDMYQEVTRIQESFGACGAPDPSAAEVCRAGLAAIDMTSPYQMAADALVALEDAQHQERIAGR